MFRTLIAVMLLTFLFPWSAQTVQASTPWWSFQSIDTMKYSRDPSREFLGDLEKLRILADEQIGQIADTGATHVAIATPYDEEFLPVLNVWVESARKHNLNVWFRGNWSGWEGWFGYANITRAQHLEQTRHFIQDNRLLFKDGDVFSACPECENGGPGDPRLNGDAVGHRKFLIDEYLMMQQEFRGITKNVSINYNSMNGDVAKLIMDKPTTQALGGVVVVDHYVRSPQGLNADISEYAELSGGKVILGEFGAPIPDIHGSQTPEQQAAWLDEALALLAKNPNLIGINYWTSVGGSTQIWTETGEAKPGVQVLTKYFTPQTAEGEIRNTVGQKLGGVEVKGLYRTVRSSNDGAFSLAIAPEEVSIELSAADYKDATIQRAVLPKTLKLARKNPSFLYRLREWFVYLFS